MDSDGYRKKLIWIAAGATALLLLIIILLARFVDPAPPKTIRLATGSPSGAYAAAGKALAERLARDGIEVELVNTSGSIENFERLTGTRDPVDVAIMQGGVAIDAPGHEDLRALCGLFYEPFWVFAQAEHPIDDLRDLAGRRVAVGPQGSGTRALAQRLLKDNGVLDRVELHASGGTNAADALLAGEVDAVIYVVAPGRPYVKQLLADPRARLLNMDRAKAYARLHRYLSSIELPRGVVDMGRDLPEQDTHLIAPAAALVAREDLHPAIADLLLEAAHAEFAQGDIIAPPRAFPSRDLVPFELSKDAARYFERGGPSALDRFLPFWAANLVDRLWVLAIPLATLLYPLIKTAPPVYRWQVQRSIVIWYRDLRRLETEGLQADSEEERERVRIELARILAEVGQLDVPLHYNDDVYRLRGHIRLVDDIISGRATHPGDAA